jgi:hypothetical protein
MTMVVNTGPDRPLDWSFERRETRGEVDPARGLIAAGANGWLYVFHQQDHRLEAFDSAGHRRWSRGREGGGPGEFRLTWTITAAPDGGVDVFDLGNLRRCRFDAEGTLLAMDPISFPPYRSRALYHGGGLAVTVPWRWGQRLAFVVGRDTVILAEHDVAAARMLTFTQCGVALRFPRLFSTEELRWDGNRDIIALTTVPEYRIEVYRGGRPTMVISRDVSPRHPSTEAMEAWYPEGFVARRQGTTCRIPVHQAARRLGWAPRVPVIRELAVDPGGRIWVVRDPPAPGRSPIDVLGSDGRYLGTLPGGTPVPIAFTSGGDPLAVEQNEAGVYRLVVYQRARGN